MIALDLTWTKAASLFFLTFFSEDAATLGGAALAVAGQLATPLGLAACFLDSAATHDLPLHGYGIRYEYGIFKQEFVNDCQVETADNWLKLGDPWSVRRYGEAVPVIFADSTVLAVPYDTPVIGYDTRTVNTLRLWRAEPMESFDFSRFNEIPPKTLPRSASDEVHAWKGPHHIQRQAPASASPLASIEPSQVPLRSGGLAAAHWHTQHPWKKSQTNSP